MIAILFCRLARRNTTGDECYWVPSRLLLLFLLFPVQSSGVPLHPCLLFHNANKSHRPLSTAPARTQTGLNSGSRSQAISECTLSRALTCNITVESSIFQIFHSQREEMSSLVFFVFFYCLFIYLFLPPLTRSPCTRAALRPTWWWSTASRREPPSSSAPVAMASSRTQSSSPFRRGLCTCRSCRCVTCPGGCAAVNASALCASTLTRLLTVGQAFHHVLPSDYFFLSVSLTVINALSRTHARTHTNCCQHPLQRHTYRLHLILSPPSPVFQS